MTIIRASGIKGSKTRLSAYQKVMETEYQLVEVDLDDVNPDSFSFSIEDEDLSSEMSI